MERLGWSRRGNFQIVMHVCMGPLVVFHDEVNNLGVGGVETESSLKKILFVKIIIKILFKN